MSDFIGENTDAVLRTPGKKKPEQKIEYIPSILRSTVFYNPDTTNEIKRKQFFQIGNLTEQWQSSDFPNLNQAVLVKRLRVNWGLILNPTNILRNIDTIKAFIELSRIEITNNGKEVTSIPLSELVQFKVVPTNNVAGATAVYNQIVDKLNHWYDLPLPLKFAAGSKPKIEFVPAAGFTTATWAANTAPVITDSDNSGLTTANTGYFLTLEMESYRAKDANA